MEQNLSLETMESKISSFDKMKFIDEDGVEKISGRDLSKALGYTDFRNFKKAVARANEQIEKNGKNDERIVELTKSFISGNGTERTGKSDYHLTRRQAINVANNADTSKQEVAMVQEWLYDNSEIGERAANIASKLKDRKYIEDRSALSIANKQLSRTCLEHGVESEELGIVHNSCDEGLYNMKTEEIKEQFGKANRPKADFLGATMCAAETFARDLTSLSIDSQKAVGVNECSDIAFDIHREIREQIQNRSGKNPEQLITGEDVKKVEQRYKKLTKKQLEAIEQEF